MHWASNCLVVLLLCVARTPVFVVVCIWNALSGYSTNKLVGWTWWGTTGQLAHGHKGGEVDSRVHMTAWWLLLSRFDAFCVFCISQYCLGCIHMLHCGGFVVICHGHDSAVFTSCIFSLRRLSNHLRIPTILSMFSLRYRGWPACSFLLNTATASHAFYKPNFWHWVALVVLRPQA